MSGYTLYMYMWTSHRGLGRLLCGELKAGPALGNWSIHAVETSVLCAWERKQ